MQAGCGWRSIILAGLLDYLDHMRWLLIVACSIFAGACAAPPPATPVPHDDPIMFGAKDAPVDVVIWVGLRQDASIAFIKNELQPLLDGPAHAGTARIRLEPVSSMDGTLPAVCVLWCVQNSVKGDLATRSQSSLLLLQAMQAYPPNGSPGYGQAWWLEEVASQAGLEPNLVTGCLRNELAAEAVRSAYMTAKGLAIRGIVTLPMVTVNGKVLNVLDTPSVTAKDILAAIKKAGS